MKLLPAKLGKNIKRQFRRFTHMHHVTLPKHQSAVHDSVVFPIITTISPPLFPAIDVVREFHPPPLTLPSSPRTGYSRDSFTKSQEADGQSSDSASSRRSIAVSEHSVQSSTLSSDDMSEKPSLTQEVAPLASEQGVEQVPDAIVPESAESSHSALAVDDLPMTDSVESLPTPPDSEPVSSSPPTVYVEPEVPDPFLIDDEESDFSDEEADSPPAITQSQLTITPPPQETAIPALMSSLPSEPATPHSLSLPSPNLNKAVPPPPSESETDEEAPDLYLPGLLIPTMFLPIPNVRRPFSSNYLTWWLSRSLMYHTCIRRIR